MHARSKTSEPRFARLNDEHDCRPAPRSSLLPPSLEQRVSREACGSQPEHRIHRPIVQIALQTPHPIHLVGYCIQLFQRIMASDQLSLPRNPALPGHPEIPGVPQNLPGTLRESGHVPSPDTAVSVLLRGRRYTPRRMLPTIYRRTPGCRRDLTCLPPFSCPE